MSTTPFKLDRRKSLLNRLIHAKAQSDKGNWKAKHSILRQLISQRPKEFYIDSERRGILGLTHRSGFRIHLPRKQLPVSRYSLSRHPFPKKRHKSFKKLSEDEGLSYFLRALHFPGDEKTSQDLTILPLGEKTGWLGHKGSLLEQLHEL